MAGHIFTVLIVGLVGMLTIHEYTRYYQARFDEEGLEYPRRRLARRTGVALLVVVTMLVLNFWRGWDLPPAAHLTLLFGVSFSMLLIFLLVLRDLREVSAAIVEERARFEAGLEKELLEMLPEEKRPLGAQKPKRKGKRERKRR